VVGGAVRWVLTEREVERRMVKVLKEREVERRQMYVLLFIQGVGVVRD
jgi:hypothetical protein